MRSMFRGRRSSTPQPTAEGTSQLRNCRPADGDDGGVFFGLPGVPDAGSPHGVVALFAEEGGAAGEVDPEAAVDEEEDGGSVFVVLPGFTLFAGRVDAPFDFDVFGHADVVG